MMRRLLFRLSLILFLLSILLYYSSTTKAIRSNLPESLAYPPPPTQSGDPGSPEYSFATYVSESFKDLYNPPYTTSYYFNTVDPGVMVEKAHEVADRFIERPGEQNGAVILDFCQPSVQSGVQGVWLCDNGGFARIAYSPTEDSIEEAARSYAEAFYNGSYSYPDTLVVIIGTSNRGDYVTTQHGIEWAEMVNRVNSWLISQGYFYRVQVVGGSNMELAWNSYPTTKNWVDGYESTNNYLLHDFGDAQGCPYERIGYDGICGGEIHQWYQSQVWDISYNGSREAFPLIYNTLGNNARQWYSLSAYSFTFHGAKMPIFGAVTQFQACQYRSGCAGIDNDPTQGYTQLQNWLNQDPDTAHELSWETDFVHNIDLQSPP